MRWPWLVSASVGLLAAAAGLMNSGCGRRSSRVEAGIKTQTLHVNLGAEPRDFDPQTTSLPADGVVISAIMEGLVTVDAIDGHAIPGVASQWEVSLDGRTWTFHLRENARWSNGDPVTAGDFVFAYRRILAPGLAAEYREQFYCLEQAREFATGQQTDFTRVGVRAPDERTLVLTLVTPVPYLPALLTQPCWFPLHRATIERFGRIDQRATAWTRPGNFVGNGAFVLAEWKPGHVVRVTKSPTYWDRDRVRLREAVLYPIENLAMGDAAFRAGQLHVTTIPVDRVAAYRSDPARASWVHEAPALQTAFLRLNCGRAPLDDVRVRRALSLAIDRVTLARRVVHSDTPAFTLTPPNCAGYTAEPGASFDAPAARRLFAEAGFPDGRGFPVLELPFYTFHGDEQPVVEALQEMWRTHLGIAVKLAKGEMKTVIAKRVTGDFVLLSSNWSGDYLDPTTFLDLLRRDASNNGTGWSNPAYDRLLDEAATLADPAQRFARLRAAEALMLAEVPVVPLFFQPLRSVRHPAVKGWHDTLLDLHPLKAVALENPAAGK